jgi:organic radical activating enzyme
MIHALTKQYSFISADITSNCNLRCPYCVNDWGSIKGNTFMTKETFEKATALLPLIKDDGHFRFSCIFEPTIHPEFTELLRMIPEKDRKKVFFTTNLAKRLSDDIFRELSEISISHINVSLDSFVPQVFESHRRLAKFDTVIDNLTRMVAIFKDNPRAPKLRYITVLGKDNISEVPSLIATTAEKYLASEHEFRAFWYRKGQDEAWVKENEITWDDLTNVGEVLRNQPYKYYFAPFEHPDDISLVHESNFDYAIYRPLPGGINLASNGMVWIDMFPEISFNLHDVRDPLAHFENICRLHLLDVDRSREINKIKRQRDQLEQIVFRNHKFRVPLRRRFAIGLYSVDKIDDINVNRGETVKIKKEKRDAIRISGWAVDRHAKDQAGGVIVKIDGKSFFADYGFPRDDVALFYKIDKYRFSGFQAIIPVAEIGYGMHTISIQVVSNDGSSFFSSFQKVKMEVELF